jgi:hypothetical protein
MAPPGYKDIPVMIRVQSLFASDLFPFSCLAGVFSDLNDPEINRWKYRK